MSMKSDDEMLCFLVEWYEEYAARIRQFLFKYFVQGKAIEMFDIKNRRPFLKCTPQDHPIELSDLFINNTINVCGRQLVIREYADEYTRKRLTEKKEKTLALVKPDALNKVGEIIDQILEKGFNISRLAMTSLDRSEAFEFYAEHQGKPFMNDLLLYIMSGPVIAMELVGENAISKWRELLGPTDSAQARKENPTSFRARFGTDKTRNAVHGSDSPESAARELEFFFPTDGKSKRKCTAKFSDSTCCVIKPHAIKAGIPGRIITAIIEAGFDITAIGLFHLVQANAEEFLEVYKGVVPEYKSMVAEMTSGPCIALEVHAQNAPTVFRELAGPADPEIARHLRPRTLRALYGVDKIRNAVHCTDLAEDGVLEVEYFFKILNR